MVIVVKVFEFYQKKFIKTMFFDKMCIPRSRFTPKWEDRSNQFKYIL